MTRRNSLIRLQNFFISLPEENFETFCQLVKSLYIKPYFNGDNASVFNQHPIATDFTITLIIYIIYAIILKKKTLFNRH